MSTESSVALLPALIGMIGIIAWSLPIIVLTVLAYSIEYYTKFRTYWKLLLLASFLAILNTAFTSYTFYTTGENSLTQILFVDLLLLSGTMSAGYASFKLMNFQNLVLGKTTITIKILAVTAVIMPAIFYIFDGVGSTLLLDSIAYNLSIVFLVLVFLTIGKISREYVPRYNRISYNLARLGSIILLFDPLQRNLAVFTGMELTSKNFVGGLTVFTHLFADLLLLPAIILLIAEARARGISLIPRSEEVDDSQPLRYRLKRGYSYLVRERNIEESLEILADYVRHGYHGLCITRAAPSDIRSAFGIHTTPILWMTNTVTDEQSIKPKDMKRLSSIIEDFIRHKGDFILIQRLDYLITQNGFESVLSFIQDVGDFIATSNSLLLIALDTSTLSRQQQALLTQELEEIETKEQTILSESLFDLLSYISGENKRKRSPNIKSVTREFSITKTTARKRIYELESMGLIKIVKEGRSKLMELTEDGKKIIKSPVGPTER